jgi:hypothetical protein
LARILTRPIPPRLVPVWLTAEEHKTLLAELPDANEAEKVKRLVEILRRAEERTEEWLLTGQGANGLPGKRSAYETIARWVILLAFFMCLFVIFSRL